MKEEKCKYCDHAEKYHSLDGCVMLVIRSIQNIFGPGVDYCACDRFETR